MGKTKLFFSLTDAIKEAGTKADSKQPRDEYRPKNEASHDPLLVEMLDGIYMLYHIAVHKQFSKVSHMQLSNG